MRLRASALYLIVVVLGMPPRDVRADLAVATGWDLLQTAPAGANFGGMPFGGVPLGAYDFGGTIGVQNVGMADTIVRRHDPAMVGASGTTPAPPIDIELVALQLRSVNPLPPGIFSSNSTDFYFITLQSARTGGGTPSAGMMDITFPEPLGLGGTFDSFFDVFYDIRYSSLSGPIVLSGNLTLSSPSDPPGTTWTRQAPPGAVLINGVNNNLNGSNNARDFWPGLINESHPNGAFHQATTALQAIPEASAVAIWCLFTSVAVVVAWKQRRAKSSR